LYVNNISTLKVPKAPGAVEACPAQIDAASFPDRPGRGDGVPCTIANVRHMLDINRVSVRYDVIGKRTIISVPWIAGTAENNDAVSMTHILSMASKYTMPTGLVPPMVEAIGDENSFNPAADWMLSKKWDRVDRLVAMCATLTPRESYPLELRDVLVTKWLFSIAAAATQPDGFKCRGVLTLQGAQGLGKTSWGLSLVDDDRLRQKLIKVDHHLDASNKDSILGVIDHLIGEIGELDSSFRRDVSRLKGFLTSGTDKIRRPYGRVTVEYQRRTVFYATVNASDFLVDDTGNKRWWTIPCVAIDFNHGVDMQQVFAQCVAMLRDGAIWWLTTEEEVLLERQNEQHRSFSVVRDLLAAVIDLDAADTTTCKPVTASEVLHLAGLERPTNGQAKECAGLLRQWFGESKRINGRDKWRVPFRPSVSLLDVTEEPLTAEEPRSKFD
jgi:predicted P-loop ATPase